MFLVEYFEEQEEKSIMSFFKLDKECCFDFEKSQFPFLVCNPVDHNPGKTLCTSPRGGREG